MRITTVVVAALTAAAAIALPSVSQAAPTTGQVVSVQPLSPAVTLPGAVNGKRIVYHTIGIGDAPALSSGAIYFPPGTPPPGGWPVIAWAHGTTGVADHCAYSIGGPVEVARDWAYLGTWLRQGYAIVATDYAGLGTGGRLAYLNGKVEAHSVVDAVKAATRTFPGTLAKRWMVVGQSQGGGAAVITARHATEFGGNELDYRGGVATGVPAHVEDAMVLLGPNMPPIKLGAHTAEYVLFLLSGLRASFPNLDINSYLTPLGRHWVDHAEQGGCAPELADELAANHVVIGDMFAKPLAALPNAHELLTEYMGIPVSGYDRPLFIGQGLTDTDVLVPGTLATAAAMQANGQPLTFHTYPTDHDGAVNGSLVDSIPWVHALLSH